MKKKLPGARPASTNFQKIPLMLFAIFTFSVIPARAQAPGTATSAPLPATTVPTAQTGGTPASGATTPTLPQANAMAAALNIVVLDPAHGGTDPGARGTGGIRESEVVLAFATQTRRALEAQGFQVLLTRQGNENPSFDDRSAMANAQQSAIFVSLHVSSTGLPGTVRVYVNSDLPAITDTS